MSAEYSAEEVREEAASFARVFNDRVCTMLTDHADLLERIKAGEGAVTYAVARKAYAALETEGDAIECMRKALIAVWPTPPAQAAQVPEGFEFNLECADAALRKLTAIHPITPPEAACIKAVIVGARALLAAPTAEPVAQKDKP